LLPSGLRFFVLLTIRVHGEILAGFHRPARSNGGTQNSPAIRIEPRLAAHSIGRRKTPDR
jgi:hypothetical protein